MVIKHSSERVQVLENPDVKIVLNDDEPKNPFGKFTDLVGKKLVYNRHEIIEELKDNYDANNVLLDRIELTNRLSDSGTKGEIEMSGVCLFPMDSTIPELKWNHVSGNTLMVLANQAGKIGHVAYAYEPGVALMKFNGRITKEVVFESITFKAKASVSIRKGRFFALPVIEFFYKGKRFATYDAMTMSVPRRYT
jgi:hypothetical protein